MINPTDTVNLQDVNAQNNIVNLRKMNCTQKTKDEQLREASQGFEAIFVTKLLQQMEDSSMNEGGFINKSRGEKMYKSMMFQEVGKIISESKTSSFGIADAIYNQLKDSV